MNTKNFLPESRFLKPKDIFRNDFNQSVMVEISKVSVEKIDQIDLSGNVTKSNDVLAIHLKGYEKPLLLGKMNVSTLSLILGDETDNWIGQKVLTSAIRYNIQGKTTFGISFSKL